MIVSCFNTDIIIDDIIHKQIVYNLTYQNSLYGIECYTQGSDYKAPNNYCNVVDFTNNEDAANKIMSKLVIGKVMPVHIQDIIMDYFPC